jgi:DNA segregation ATPase FtsK/SpoIIIE-like protein
VDDGPAVDVLAENKASISAPSTEHVKPMTVQEAAALAGVQVAETTVERPTPSASEKKKTTEAVKAETEDISRIIEEKSAEVPQAYAFPPVDLLRQTPGTRIDGREEAELNRERVSATLRSFGVNAAVPEITRAPPSPVTIWSWSRFKRLRSPIWRAIWPSPWASPACASLPSRTRSPP